MSEESRPNIRKCRANFRGMRFAWSAIIMRTLVSILGLMFVSLGSAACQSESCTALGIVREMAYEATLPASIDARTATIEVCFGTACDVARLATSPNASATELRCEDLDTRTEKFPTQCKFTETERKISFETNTVYGGHAGTDKLVVTVIAQGGARTEILRGTVAYTDTTDDAARGACTEAWAGTFRKD